MDECDHVSEDIHGVLVIEHADDCECGQPRRISRTHSAVTNTWHCTVEFSDKVVIFDTGQRGRFASGYIIRQMLDLEPLDAPKRRWDMISSTHHEMRDW